uniref:integrase n=1 Tax=Lactobacillus acidophilus TaxID=1579 RepID=UPI003F555B87
MTDYAMYKGDKFIDLGTIDYLTKKYHKKKKSLKFLATPSAHKRSAKNRLLLYRIKED